MANGFNVTLGGERLGSGKKQKVHLHGYERSTFDLSHAVRLTASAGTVIPFLVRPALPGDTWDITFNLDALTHPTIGPLFGSYKIQVDVFEAQIRLYQRMLHNNRLGIGREMEKVLLPQMTLYAMNGIKPDLNGVIDSAQINQSTLLAYLGIRGIGNPNREASATPRTFNGTALLAYYDICKNYYWPKNENIGGVVGYLNRIIPNVVDYVMIGGNLVPKDPATGTVDVLQDDVIYIYLTKKEEQNLKQVQFNFVGGGSYNAEEMGTVTLVKNEFQWYYQIIVRNLGDDPIQVMNWAVSDQSLEGIGVQTFDLANIDTMRDNILSADNYTAFNINEQDLQPYSTVLFADLIGRETNYKVSQLGLAVKAYQSDLFNNWLDRETIEGNNGINEITAVDITDNKFTIDALIFARKVYDYLNRVNVAGGTFDDWLDTTYTDERITKVETPIYHGGMSQELVFQEVVSNSASEDQPLGTLAGRGVVNNNMKKGGKVTIKVQEPSYIIAMVSLTPRVDYSQGNAWDINLQSLNDFHKPAMDAIGFQDLIAERMAWWTTIDNAADPTNPEWVQKSVGKQPAWVEYMTEVNRTYGAFAEENNEMFMTLNRRYEPNETYDSIKDATALIDPTKFNNIFAVETIEAMNFWIQIGIGIEKRSKMSSKVMPTL